MPPGVTIFGSLSLLVIFIAPGLTGIKVYLKFAKQPDQMDQLDSVIYSILVSVASILILYFLTWVVNGWPPTVESLQAAFSIPLFIHGYLSLILIAVLGGLYRGLWVSRIKNSKFSFQSVSKSICGDELTLGDAVAPIWAGDQQSTREDLWDYVFDNIYSNSTVRIYRRNSEDPIEGSIVLHGHTSENDLLLSPAPREDLEEEEEYIYKYVPSQEVSHIAFNEDLNENDADVAQREVDDDSEKTNPSLEQRLVDYAINEFTADAIVGRVEGVDEEDKEEVRDLLR